MRSDAPTASGAARVLGTTGKPLLRLWPFVLVVLAWHAWITLNAIEPTVAPTPASVLQYLLNQPGSYLRDAWQTFSLAGMGLTCGVMVGVVLATAAWASRCSGGSSARPRS